MTQWQFDTTLKIIELGAPILYQELGGALNNLIVERNKLDQENKELKAQLEAFQKPEAVIIDSADTKETVKKDK